MVSPTKNVHYTGRDVQSREATAQIPESEIWLPNIPTIQGYLGMTRDHYKAALRNSRK